MAQSRRRSSGQARSSRKKKTAASGGRSVPGWLWGLGGLVVGLFVALIVHLEQRTTDAGLDRVLNRDGGGSATTEAPSGGGDRSTPDAADDQPHFEFYKLLPEQEVAVPDAPADEGDDTPPTDTGPTADQGTDAGDGSATASASRYLLQAGSFRRYADADRMKAKLALLGVEAGIQSVELAGGETWHRVRAGPYGDRAAVNNVRQRLRSNEIDTILLQRGE